MRDYLWAAGIILGTYAGVIAIIAVSTFIKGA